MNTPIIKRILFFVILVFISTQIGYALTPKHKDITEESIAKKKAKELLGEDADVWIDTIEYDGNFYKTYEVGRVRALNEGLEFTALGYSKKSWDEAIKIAKVKRDFMP